MNNFGEKISDLLNIDPLVPNLIEEPITELVESLPQNGNLDDDVYFARDNIRDLVKKGNVAFTEILKVAKESQHPRAYEVAATLLKNLSDLNKDLLELHKRKEDLEPKDYGRQNINVDKAVVFTGSTTELVKLIKKNMEE